MKANSNLAVLKLLGQLGAGADTVSEGEIRKALAAGIPAVAHRLFGRRQDRAELAFAVEAGIHQINIETEGELDRCSHSRRAPRHAARAAVFRINPDVGAGGHAKITTGASDNKFGISLGEAERLYACAANLPGVAHGRAGRAHRQPDPRAGRSRGRLQAHARRSPKACGRGAMRVERLDLGGGLGIPYDMAEAVEHGPDLIQDYAAMVRRTFAGLDVELGFEPGRLIVGNAGLLLTRVSRSTRGRHKRSSSSMRR